MDNIYNLKDEELWMQYMLTLASNPKLATSLVEEDAIHADILLQEFKARFTE